MTAGPRTLDTPHYIRVGDLPVEVVRKNIKNIHLAVYPPDGHVRVATPALVDDDAIRLFTIARLPWIRTQQRRFQKQERQSPREYVSGESHYFQGQRYRLRVTERPGPPEVQVRGKTVLHMGVPAGSTREQREVVMTEWYRGELKAMVPEIIERWSQILGVPAPKWRIKRMTRKWGSYSSRTHMIWLNLELSKVSIECLDYIVLHEIVHSIDRTHGEKFKRIMSSVLPDWRNIRNTLQSFPLTLLDK